MTDALFPCGCAAGPVDKVKDRLEEIEEAEKEQESGPDTVKVTQQEFLDQIEGMHNELLQAWNENQRVQALKIAIQCSKFLSDTTVIKFYPSKFILITEILDTFGRLVFDRLRGRSVIYDSINAVPVPLPEDFKAEDVTPSARETCRNWFYKIASIRELLPRMYVFSLFLSRGGLFMSLIKWALLVVMWRWLLLTVIDSLLTTRIQRSCNVLALCLMDWVIL